MTVAVCFCRVAYSSRTGRHCSIGINRSSGGTVVSEEKTKVIDWCSQNSFNEMHHLCLAADLCIGEILKIGSPTLHKTTQKTVLALYLNFKYYVFKFFINVIPYRHFTTEFIKISL